MVTNHLKFSTWFRSIFTAIFMLGGLFAFAQQNISGTILDETGEGLPGVTIQEVGTSNGTITDIEGNYSLTVSSGAQISISFVGFVTQIVTVGTQSRIDVTMATDTKALDEVVVIGYGTQKRSDLTGSIVSVSGDALKKVPVASVAESLTGRLAGVQVTSTEGSPDAQVNIRVRGGGSLTQDNSPLIIVDGFPVNSLSDIAPSDIKTIDVLKDASSTAIYGSRGANGVIIITTKTGSTGGKISVSFNSFYGARKIANKLDVLNPEDYARWQYEYAMLDDPEDISSYTNFFGGYSDLDLYQGVPANDWQSIIYGRVGQVSSNDVNISGGSDRSSFSANYARYDDKAIMIGSSFTRNNLTFKLNNKPNDKVDLAFSLRYSDTRISGGGANEQNEVSSADSRLKHSIGYSPIPLPGLTTGVDDTNEQTAGDLVNPIASTRDNDREQTRKNYNIGGSVTWRITDVLQLRSDMGLDNYNLGDNRFYGLTTYFVKNRPAADFQNQPAVVLRDRKDVRLRNTNTISYDFKELLPADHNLRILAGNEILKTESQQLTSEIHGFPSGFTSDQAFSLTTQGKSLFFVDNNLSPDDKLLSYFSRINYEFKGRYLLSATYRADGSSKFLGDNRWGYFPSAAAAWKISEESFMQGTSGWLNSLKLRVSYGQSGNNNIPTGQTLQTFQSSTTSWINGFTSYWAASKTLANPDLKWETTVTRNIGLDFGLFAGKVIGSFDAYQNNTNDLLIRFPVPGTGYDTQFRNLGETQNRGLEASVQYYPIETKDYGLNFNFNISFNQNEIISLGSLDDFGQASGWASTQIPTDYFISAGGPIGQMRGFVSDGRYEVSDFDYNSGTGTYTLKSGVADASGWIGTVQPGMMKLKDLNGDDIVNIEDQRIIGNANAKHTGGFVINGYAYGFDMSAAFSWSYGNDIYNANKIEFTTANRNNQYRNLSTIQASGQRWTNIDPATGALVTDPVQLTSLNENTTMWSPYMSRYVFSDWAVEDGSFLRLNTLTFGYTIPASLVSKYRISSLRFYTTAYNVFVLTNYSGFDPEVSTRRNTPLTPGVDYSAYPRSRMLVFGLNATF
jgi:TonB-linked SusC/RagA family outer membrane protein